MGKPEGTFDSMRQQPRVLLLDDNVEVLTSSERAIRSLRPDLRVDVADRADKALCLLASGDYDAGLVDVMLVGSGPRGGLEVIRESCRRGLRTRLGVFSALGDEIAEEALTAGARTVLCKPCGRSDLCSALSLLLEEAELVDEGPTARLIGASDCMRGVRALVKSFARESSTVLITGPTGSGKELVARALHEIGRPDQEFVAVDCGALTPSLATSELFGHARGAFTDARGEHLGFLEQAGRGTLLLDE
ncbi:MAG TPA: sigma 54-interacting transcriptional regulator, partial [Gemmatimonadaceae bacterium]|nr:sigma 54-interacting transcriptional regulator [Gemmatimonadaceae bacterium]